jgi:hypothetical protein
MATVGVALIQNSKTKKTMLEFFIGLSILNLTVWPAVRRAVDALPAQEGL